MNHSEYSWRARTPAWLAGLALMLAWPGGCKQEAAIGAEPVATGGAGVGGASGALGCPSDKGPQMVLLPAPDGTNYCMDARETTRAEYDAFVKAKAADTSGQPSACAWNTSFTPTLVTEDADTFPSPYYCYDTDWNDMRPDQAVGCVDFCDALAYCEWAGKRLCGQVGKGAERVNQFTGTLKEWA